VATGEAAFALGCHKPAHIGEYLVLDAFAMILASMLNAFAGSRSRRPQTITVVTMGNAPTAISGVSRTFG
jgi:hypothetical protein